MYQFRRNWANCQKTRVQTYRPTEAINTFQFQLMNTLQINTIRRKELVTSLLVWNGFEIGFLCDPSSDGKRQTGAN